jgi:hypothetical protein
MTALDKQLARTFRAARWEITEGVPGCPDCFDGDDLEKPTPDLLTPGLSRYRCRVCRVEFSDVKGTVFDTRKPVPLTLWGYLALHGDPRLLLWSEKETQRCFDLVARIKSHPLAASWREQLEAAGITTDRLRRVLIRRPEAA